MELARRRERHLSRAREFGKRLRLLGLNSSQVARGWGGGDFFHDSIPCIQKRRLGGIERENFDRSNLTLNWIRII